MAPRAVDLTGKQYGDWTVLARSHCSARRQWYWSCRCACGELKTVRGAHLVSGRSLRCKDCFVASSATRGGILVTWGGHTMTFKEWAATVGHPMERMYHRLHDGWTLTECLSVGTDPVILDLLGLDSTCRAEQSGP